MAPDVSRTLHSSPGADDMPLTTLFDPANVYDQKTRLYVENSLTELCLQSKDNLSLYTELVAVYTNPAKSFPLTDLMNVLQWTSSVLAATADKSVLLLLGQVLEKLLLDSSSLKPDDRHRRVGRAAVRTVRHALVGAIQTKNASSSSVVAEYIEELLQKSSSLAGVMSLCTLAGAVYDTLHEYPQEYHVFETKTQEILQLYASVVLGSKTPLSKEAVRVFEPLFANFVSEQLFNTELRPAISKSLLRAPETMLVYIVPGLLSAVPSSVDLSTATNDHLIAALLSSMGSSNAQLRLHACETSIILLQHCTNQELLASGIAVKIINTLKKTSSPDQRVLLGKTLASITPAFGVISESMCPILAKEANEAALLELVRAFVNHLSPSQGSLSDSQIDVVVKGVTEKRLPLRRIWTCTLVEFAPEFLTNTEKIKTALAKSFAEISASPGASVQNKVIAAAYAYLTLIKDGRNSLVLDPKVFTRLSEDDLYWAIKAAATFSPSKEDHEWGAAWVYFGCKDPKHAVPCLQKLYKEAPEVIGSSLMANFNHLDDQEGLAKLITNVFGTVANNMMLAKLAVVAHHPNATPKKNGWIGLCIQSGVDPVNIVNSPELLSIIMSDISKILVDNAGTAPSVVKASADTLCSLAFVNSEVVTPKIVELMSRLLAVDHIFTEEETLIFNSPEGELVKLETTTSKAAVAEHKNSKEYQEREWEETVRKEIEAKKAKSGAASGGDRKKKLTKEEELQLKEQTETRKQLAKEISNYEHGLAIIDSLSKSPYAPSTSPETWFSCATMSVVTLLEKVALVHQHAVNVYLQLAENISNRLDTIMRQSCGLAVIRFLFGDSIITSVLGDQFAVEPVKELVLRVLYKFRFVSDQSSFDLATLVYILPLLLKILQKPDDDEQVLLTLEILAIHSKQIAQPGIDSNSIVISLIKLLKSSSGAKDVATRGKQVKETLMSLSQSLHLSTMDELAPFLDAILEAEDNFVKATLLEILDSEADLMDIGYTPAVFISLFDEDNVVADFAADIWKDNNMKIVPDTPNTLLAYLGSKNNSSRVACAKAVARSVHQLQQLQSAEDQKDTESTNFTTMIETLIKLYIEKAKPPTPMYDKYGIPIPVGKLDDDVAWLFRSGVAMAFKEMAPLFQSQQSVLRFFEFAIYDGPSLADTSSEVRSQMQAAGLEIIKLHGVENIEALIPVFDKYLAKPDSESQDEIREAVIIFYGSLASHLDPDDERIIKILDTLFVTLDTPSEDIQYAVSLCLAPLVKVVDSDHVHQYITNMLEKTGTGANIAERKGAAYGLAGLVKGVGIASLADYDIIRDLSEACEDKKLANRRQGAQFAFECLSLLLNKYFEPYVIEILPLILNGLGDASLDVRSAASDAAKQIMKNTTGYGIKKMIPLALENLNLTAWRAKKGAVELLGTMAYLDPRQLSGSLSVIIPELVGVLGDTHKEVRNAANSSLKKFGDVIRNPEIHALVPVLIKAISDPTKHTDEALDGLLKTQFVHYIDAPSLALVTYVLHRGLKDRSASTKKKACQIVGNMSILTDAKDLVPYLPGLVGELESAMVDPVPATRAMASKALGSLVEKLGEEHFPDIVDRLMNVLKDPNRAGDRLGSAQALSEVIYGLGVAKLEELLPAILSNCKSNQPWVREGFMPMLLFLPACFGQSLSPYLSQIIPPILTGLADTNEYVHDTALKAGRRLVKGYASKAVDLMLPELEKGLADLNYRIRMSSVELTGDLLYQITGVSSTAGEEESVSSEVNKTLVGILGQERRDRVLSLLYICRADSYVQVRNPAVEVWKSLVANTPRTVKEILPVLTQIIIKRLASTDDEQRNIAAEALGDVVKRVGGTTLKILLPTLEEGMVPGVSDAVARQGICIALVSLVKSSSASVLEEFRPAVISIVKQAVIDSDPKVREAASQAFEALQEDGDNAVDAILPNLISLMEQGDERALEAAKDMMVMKSDAVFPVICPALLKAPMTANKAKALAGLSTVAGVTLYKRLSSIMDALVVGITETGDSDDRQTLEDALDTVMLSVTNDDGAHLLMTHMLALANNEDIAKRKIMFAHVSTCISKTVLDVSSFSADWIPLLVTCLDNDNDDELVESGFKGLSAICKKSSKEELQRLVRVTRQSLLSHTSVGPISGFNKVPKGPGCILPIFLQGLMYGSNIEREESALAIGAIIDRCTAESLKPFVTQITGPLIRTIGERFPADVKAAILLCSNKLLTAVPQFLKPFLPQLQRTFVKSLSDTSANDLMRARAARALGTLISLQPRVDPLVSELITGINTTTDNSVVKAMTQALSEIVIKAGNHLSAASRTSLINFVFAANSDSGPEDPEVVVRAKILAGVVQASSIDEEESLKLVKTLMTSPSSLYNKCVVYNALLVHAKDVPAVVASRPALIKFFLSNLDLSADNIISDNSVIGLGKILLTLTPESSEDEQQKDLVHDMFVKLAEATTKDPARSSDTRRLSLVVIRTVARLNYSLIQPYISDLVLAIFACVRDTNIPIKLSAEKAYLAIFKLVEDEEGTCFKEWFDKNANNLNAQQQRQISDYMKRVATRLAAGERDRIADGGDDEEVFSDRLDDEKEIWSITTHETNIE